MCTWGPPYVTYLALSALACRTPMLPWPWFFRRQIRVDGQTLLAAAPFGIISAVKTRRQTSISTLKNWPLAANDDYLFFLGKRAIMSNANTRTPGHGGLHGGTAFWKSSKRRAGSLKVSKVLRKFKWLELVFVRGTFGSNVLKQAR